VVIGRRSLDADSDQETHGVAGRTSRSILLARITSGMPDSSWLSSIASALPPPQTLSNSSCASTTHAATHAGSAWPPRSAPRWPSPRRTRYRGSRCSTCSRSRAVAPMAHARSIRAEAAAPRARKRTHLAAEVPEDDSAPLNVHARDCKCHTKRHPPFSFLRLWPDHALLRPTVGGILSSGMPGLRPKMPLSCSSSVCR
jgi:hypothetical protein